MNYFRDESEVRLLCNLVSALNGAVCVIIKFSLLLRLFSSACPVALEAATCALRGPKNVAI